jgi:organic hydroperoxide reductase OsmC/OhrA
MSHPFPHTYVVTSSVGPLPEVILETPNVAPLRTALPQEFDGPGDRWSPETLFVAAIADCYAMTFRGIAAKSRLAWDSLTLKTTATLDRVDGVTRFTDVEIRAHLLMSDCASEGLATRVLEKAEQTCLVTRSLTAAVHLRSHIECARHRELAPAV